MENNNWNSVGAKTLTEAFEDNINGYYFQFWLWTVIGLPLLVIIVGVFPLIVATVFQCIILYHAWNAIPNNPWKVPPIFAVLFLFVFIVGAIWSFWAYWLMSKEMNRELTQKGDSYRANEQLIFASCVLNCIAYGFMCIPTPPTVIIGIIIAIPAGIVDIYAIRSIKNGILALHRHESV